jgi:hypothetical protein
VECVGDEHDRDGGAVLIYRSTVVNDCLATKSA